MFDWWYSLFSTAQRLWCTVQKRLHRTATLLYPTAISSTCKLGIPKNCFFSSPPVRLPVLEARKENFPKRCCMAPELDKICLKRFKRSGIIKLLAPQPAVQKKPAVQKNTNESIGAGDTRERETTILFASKWLNTMPHGLLSCELSAGSKGCIARCEKRVRKNSL